MVKRDIPALVAKFRIPPIEQIYAAPTGRLMCDGIRGQELEDGDYGTPSVHDRGVTRVWLH